MTTVRGQLEYGLEHNGVLHYDVEMRLVTIEDNIAALEQVGTASGMRITAAMFAQAIVSLGTIPKAEITYELLVKGLADTEYDVLAGLQERIKKKRRRAKPGSPDTGSSSSSSAPSASASPTSGQ